MFRQLDLTRGATLAESFSVSELNRTIRQLIENTPELGDLWVKGEVSNFTRASSGHCYFTLKDATAQVGCLMWRNVAGRQSYLPQNGDRVSAHGRVSVYEAGGRYQLYVDQILPAGEGDLYQQLKLLEERLRAEGLFDPDRKQPLPALPGRIGVVTSQDAAALRDIVNVLSRRYPLAEVLLSPTLVQGAGAPDGIVKALSALNEREDVDVIIVARGGGSLEDLWAFNDERVARAVAASRLPVVCGVGHETDTSLADFAADVRAPTPSAAAELVAPDRAELRAQVADKTAALAAALRSLVEDRRWRLAEQTQALKHLSPSVQLLQARQRVDDLLGHAEIALTQTLALHSERLSGLVGRLESVSPMGTLARGYAIVRLQAGGDVVRSIGQVETGDVVGIRVVDGAFDATVSE